ncbi:hypothetical protein PRUPE_2G018400 [Prunus persica]|uniref:Clathrin/coatomer adaptor adaptin-like N-terminal domain-containing protein n=1 Tax=Prunus persica TaxID=3760 RepID=A0A251Q9J6_PRUPE|nr:hypothetical protein PRUPE_2G018400 [Prunus persica]
MEELKTIGRELAMVSQGGFGQSKEFLHLVKSIGEARSKAEEERISDNYLVVCAALNAVCKLINDETVPAVLPQVVDVLAHPKDAVRKKAIMALHRFYQKSPSSRLCDNDPGVMGATLCPLFDLITIDVNSYKDLVVSFVSILKQVAERRLPNHQLPAPFIQILLTFNEIRLLKILALLGSGDKQSSEKMYMVVGDIFRKCDSTSNIGNAVLYECICCVSAIYPNPKLLEQAAQVISRFLKISPEGAEQHQLAVIDWLEDPDDTLKRKTFELLYKMTKSSNAEVIVDPMIEYMISINDNHYKTYIGSRCVELAEQFAPSNQWFIQTMNKVFEHAGDLVNVKVAHNLMKLIAEGFGEDDDSADSFSFFLPLSSTVPDKFSIGDIMMHSPFYSTAICVTFEDYILVVCLQHFVHCSLLHHLQHFVESYLRIIGEPKLPSVFLQVICWVLGEYGTADGKYSASYIIGKSCDVAEAYSNEEPVKYAFEISAQRKVDILPECQSLVDELSASHATDLQQRAYELQAVISLDAPAVESIMPSDASCEDIEIDKSLSFLNGYVQQALEKGAQPYIPENERSGMLNISNFSNQDQREALTHGLRFEAYELPKPAVPSRIPPAAVASSTELVPVPEPSYAREIRQPASLPPVSDAGSSELELRLDGVQRKWGRPTYSSPAFEWGLTQIDSVSTSNSKALDTYESRRPQVEISPEKQKLASSLFGGSSKIERRPSSANHKVSKANIHASEKPQVPKAAAVHTEVNHEPAPELLDLGDSTSSTASTVDPFKQLEGLLDQTEVALTANHGAAGAAKTPDIMGLYADTSLSGLSSSVGDPLPTNRDEFNLASELSNATRTAQSGVTQLNKGPNPKDSLEKDALVRQMGVTPTSQNPNLYKDLLG